MALSPDTDTIPEERRAGIFTDDHPVTALRLKGQDDEHAMLACQDKFSFGRNASCDISVSGKHISDSHALLERRGGMVRVTDLASKNRLVFRGEERKQFEIGPGDSFSIDDMVFYALSDAMRMIRPLVADIVSPQRGVVVDDLLMAAVRGPHIFVRAEPGCEQYNFAHAVHRMSLRRRHKLVVAIPGTKEHEPTPQLVERARNGTLLLRLDLRKDVSRSKLNLSGDPDLAKAQLDAEFVEALLRPDTNVRVIVCAQTLIETIASLTGAFGSTAYTIDIPPLRQRPGEIPSLMERRFIDRQAQLRFSDFTDGNQAALRSHSWPENLEELGEIADLLIPMVGYGTVREAASHVEGYSRSTVNRRLDDCNLAIPLLREGIDKPARK